MIGLAFGALSSLGTIGQFAGNLMGAFARRGQAEQDIRATEIQKNETIGYAQAQSGASGVELSSASTMDYLAGLGAEFDRTLALKRSAQETGFIADLFGAGSSAVGGIANTANQLNALNPASARRTVSSLNPSSFGTG